MKIFENLTNFVKYFRKIEKTERIYLKSFKNKFLYDRGKTLHQKSLQ
jgi:hypothetical protein